jgi:hypothetical protein
MEGAKDTKPQPGDTTRARDEQATSDKTLADLARTQSDADAGKGGGSETGSRTEGSSPSPDGAADSPRGGRADGSDTGGPM